MLSVLSTTIAKKPRLYGGLISAGFLFSLLLWAIHSLPAAAAISLAWFLGLLIGGKLPLFRWYIFSRSHKVPAVSLSWGRAFWGGLVGAVSVSYLIGGLAHMITLLAVLPAPFALCYATSKLGCWRFGCCNWAPTSHHRLSIFRMRPALPFLEAFLSLVLAMALCFALLAGTSPGVIFGAFLIGHGSIRCMSILGRRQAGSVATLLVRKDSGLILATGIILLGIGVCCLGFSIPITGASPLF